MKCNPKRNLANLELTGLTLEQVLSTYVKPFTPKEYWPQCEFALKVINPTGGEWLWPNARLLFTRTGENSYSVKKCLI